jgi:hypothetical protein
MRLPAIRAALGVTQNRTVIAACRRFDIPVVSVSCRLKAIRASDFETFISRAAGKELAKCRLKATRRPHSRARLRYRGVSEITS